VHSGQHRNPGTRYPQRGTAQQRSTSNLVHPRSVPLFLESVKTTRAPLPRFSRRRRLSDGRVSRRDRQWTPRPVPERLPLETTQTRTARMRATGVTANLRVADIEIAKAFYTDYWASPPRDSTRWVASYASRQQSNIQRNAGRNSAAGLRHLSQHRRYRRCLRRSSQRGYEIVHPITTEPWGCADSLFGHPTAMSSIVNHSTIGRCFNSALGQPPKGRA